MSQDDHLVIVLDDDPSLLSSLDRLLQAAGHPARCHTDPEGFFAAGPPTVPACLLLDYELANGKNGADVHAEIQHRDWNLPTVFLTAHTDVELVVSAMRAGADGYLAKPFKPGDLLEEIDRALNHARKALESDRSSAELQRRAESLTPREREIVVMVTAGLLNKEIADRLDIALITVKVHRGRAMRKLQAGNAAELGQIAIRAGIVDPT